MKHGLLIEGINDINKYIVDTGECLTWQHTKCLANPDDIKGNTYRCPALCDDWKQSKNFKSSLHRHIVVVIHHYHRIF